MHMHKIKYYWKKTRGTMAHLRLLHVGMLQQVLLLALLLLTIATVSSSSSSSSIGSSSAVTASGSASESVSVSAQRHNNNNNNNNHRHVLALPSKTAAFFFAFPRNKYQYVYPSPLAASTKAMTLTRTRTRTVVIKQIRGGGEQQQLQDDFDVDDDINDTTATATPTAKTRTTRTTPKKSTKAKAKKKHKTSTRVKGANEKRKKKSEAKKQHKTKKKKRKKHHQHSKSTAASTMTSSTKSKSKNQTPTRMPMPMPTNAKEKKPAFIVPVTKKKKKNTNKQSRKQQLQSHHLKRSSTLSANTNTNTTAQRKKKGKKKRKSTAIISRRSTSTSRRSRTADADADADDATITSSSKPMVQNGGQRKTEGEHARTSKSESSEKRRVNGEKKNLKKRKKTKRKTKDGSPMSYTDDRTASTDTTRSFKSRVQEDPFLLLSDATLTKSTPTMTTTRTRTHKATVKATAAATDKAKTIEGHNIKRNNNKKKRTKRKRRQPTRVTTTKTISTDMTAPKDNIDANAVCKDKDDNKSVLVEPVDTTTVTTPRPETNATTNDDDDNAEGDELPRDNNKLEEKPFIDPKHRTLEDAQKEGNTESSTYGTASISTSAEADMDSLASQPIHVSECDGPEANNVAAADDGDGDDGEGQTLKVELGTKEKEGIEDDSSSAEEEEEVGGDVDGEQVIPKTRQQAGMPPDVQSETVSTESTTEDEDENEDEVVDKIDATEKTNEATAEDEMVEKDRKIHMNGMNASSMHSDDSKDINIKFHVDEMDLSLHTNESDHVYVHLDAIHDEEDGKTNASTLSLSLNKDGPASTISTSTTADARNEKVEGDSNKENSDTSTPPKDDALIETEDSSKQVDSDDDRNGLGQQDKKLNTTNAINGSSLDSAVHDALQGFGVSNGTQKDSDNNGEEDTEDDSDTDSDDDVEPSAADTTNFGGAIESNIVSTDDSDDDADDDVESSEKLSSSTVVGANTSFNGGSLPHADASEEEISSTSLNVSAVSINTTAIVNENKNENDNGTNTTNEKFVASTDGEKPAVEQTTFTPKSKPVNLTELLEPKDRPSDIDIAVVTWNLAEASPSEEEASFLRKFRGNDLVLISGQECENIKPRRAEGHRSREFRRLMIKMLGKKYIPLAMHMIGGIQFGLFCKRSYLHNVEFVSVADVTCGIGNVFHNKGAIGAYLQVRANNKGVNDGKERSKSVRMLLIGAHLAAHVKNFEARDADFWRIVQELEVQAPPKFLRPNPEAQEGVPKSPANSETGSYLLDSMDRVFFCGDLNYRIDLPREEVEYNVLKMGSSTKGADTVRDSLLRHDQLLASMAERRAFTGLLEGKIAFLPTFKFDKGSEEYDTSHKQRVPAWTDRIVFKPAGTRILEYASVPEALHSDHRPVFARFRTQTIGREVKGRSTTSISSKTRRKRKRSSAESLSER